MILTDQVTKNIVKLFNNGIEYKCEVKLMGKGNPEVADAVIARDSNIFVADKLSDQNKLQLSQRNVEWVEMRHTNGYQRFEKVLKKFKIPHKKFSGSLNKKIDKILKNLKTLNNEI